MIMIMIIITNNSLTSSQNYICKPYYIGYNGDCKGILWTCHIRKVCNWSRGSKALSCVANIQMPFSGQIWQTRVSYTCMFVFTCLAAASWNMSVYLPICVSACLILYHFHSYKALLKNTLSNAPDYLLMTFPIHCCKQILPWNFILPAVLLKWTGQHNWYGTAILISFWINGEEEKNIVRRQDLWLLLSGTDLPDYFSCTDDVNINILWRLLRLCVSLPPQKTL